MDQLLVAELAIDNIFVGARFLWGVTRCALRRTGLLVSGGTYLLHNLHQVIGGFADAFYVIGVHHRPDFTSAIFHLLLQVGGDFVSQIAQHFFCGVHGVIGIVAGFHQLFAA